MDYWSKWELYLTIGALGWLTLQLAVIALLAVIAYGLDKLRKHER